MEERVSTKFSDNAIKVLEKRYLRKNDEGVLIEGPKEMLWRVASAVAGTEETYGGDS